jgi:non-ribosomal peptide synthase protein (TIGR01720 family)
LEYVGRRDEQVKLRGYRIELGEIEAVLEQHESVRECVVAAREGASGGKRLVGYVVAEPGAESSVSELRTFLKERLPEYMVPTAWVMMEALPLTPNGKIERRALPAPDFFSAPSASAAHLPRLPASPTEHTLAAIWAQVLGLHQVSPADNFFELGGDSILCIQVVARANQAGLQLSPRDLFEHQTIAELATAADARAAAATLLSAHTPAAHSVAESSERVVPLTPIQRWFFAQRFRQPHHWNQSVLLATRRPLARAQLATALAALVERHAALRLRFRQDSAGRWEQRLVPWAAVAAAPLPVHEVDLSEVEASERARVLERSCGEVQGSLEMEGGWLLRCVLFKGGADEGAAGGERGGERWERLLIAAHHLITDGVSWRLLLDELQRAYEQAESGAAIKLGLVGRSFADWAEGLAVYAETEEFKAQTGYWEAAERAAREFRLPIEVSRATNIESSTEQVTVKLSASQTRALLQEVPRVYRTQINDVLLTALGRALSRWVGRRRVVVELEGHGREDLGLEGLDVSGAMGWFTSLYPVVLEAEWGASGESLKAVKEQLRAVPRKGVGYGVWRFLKSDGEATANAAPAGGEVSFNYFGQLDNVLEADAPFAAAAESAGESRYGDDRRPFKLSVVGSVRGGELVMAWKYSRNLHLHETIKTVAADYIKALAEIIDHCRSVQAGGFTPSDFPMVNLNQQQLDKIISRVGKARSS